MRQLEELGCVLKDLAQGLVDFYVMREGELVFLCWKQGEERIRFWHPLEALDAIASAEDPFASYGTRIRRECNDFRW